MQRTLVLIKPDAFQRNMAFKIMHRIENKGYEMETMKYWPKVSKEMIERHYEQDKEKAHFPLNCDFMTSGPIMSIIYKGEGVISGIRKLQGTRDTPGTIRGDWVTDVRRNLIHASDSEENAVKEISIWFPSL